MQKILPVRFGEQLLAMTAISKIASQSDPNVAWRSLIGGELGALFNLCDDIHAAREYMERTEFFEPFANLDTIRCCQLALHGWQILNATDNPLPGDPKHQQKVLSFFQIWDERFKGWRDKSTWCFETEPRIKAILYFLLNWHTMDLKISGDTSRGCARWLKENRFIPEDAETKFDDDLKRTIVIS